MHAGVAKGIDRFLSTQGYRGGYALFDTDRLRTSLMLPFANSDKLLIQALGAHAHAYGEAANTEAGFDLGIVGRKLVIEGPEERVVFYATMKTEAYEHLRLIGRQDFFEELTQKRRESLSVTGSSKRIPRSESLLDLLSVALPCTTEKFGMSTPAAIVESFARLARFVAAPVADFD
ncbi:hypothetical protein ACVWXL_005754 [Bradyrhizobium sp. GM22.5]